MRIDLFDYELPEGHIATRPLPGRDDGRLLIVDPRKDELEDARIADLVRLIPTGALVVLNDTRVLPARLVGKKAATGGRAELLLLERIGEKAGGLSVERWRAIGKSSKPLRPGAHVLLGDTGRLVARLETPGDADGVMEIVLYTSDGGTVDEALAACGTVPLPPYLRREAEALDLARYQTVYAKVPGAVAAPTAGLHLSTPLLDELARAGIHIATLTLHVGLGTFRPVTVEDLDQHKMHEEALVVPASLVAAVREARGRRAPVVAVGTTVVRALETAADPEEPGAVRAVQGRTNLLIQPGFRFRVVDALLTNFHLPRSSLLALVAAFAGRERVLGAYREAIRRGYRFYSYGDAMFIPRAKQGPRVIVAGEGCAG